ncbi:hypothetical protein ASPZODRAFT_62658 [Penicilliopsis zonata CBS 506.65]|uniref:Phosphoglycerate mutase n=1 Tax=Penicilliopsis zonata CBS 506.65 TaxID=1073090 RepID=A0A1L9SNQ8_9EURO|nr:hypothetical protein ASPZODRAFT_62658 [Penicilliopsis zonata CBS 506.65]OJJ48743.1 hypothetical protein ASPZODRAFT_62658 [Penicilliopsis zonata CBS 506.65]
MMGGEQHAESYLELSNVPGYFLQDEEATDPAKFDYTSNFGLIERPYGTDADFDPDGRQTQWQRFEQHIRQLNAESDATTSYRVLFLGRHGQGYHNVAEDFYGTEAWDCYWSLQEGDEKGTWIDAHLTPLGVAQAQTAHSAWESQLAQGIPIPQSFYVSPLNRCLATANVTFSGLNVGFEPIIKENIRETIGLHTCDKRSTKAEIAAEYPLYTFEEGFTETDPLWDAQLRESNSARDARLLQAVREIVAGDSNIFISLTAHSGAITSILKVTGHRPFALTTGGVIPVVVMVRNVHGRAPVMEIEPPTTAPKCIAEEEVKQGVRTSVEIVGLDV